MLKVGRDEMHSVVRRESKRLDPAAIEQARDITLLVLTERHGYSIRLAAAYLGMPRSTAHDRLNMIPSEARERYLRGSSPLTLVGLGPA